MHDSSQLMIACVISTWLNHLETNIQNKTLYNIMPYSFIFQYLIYPRPYRLYINIHWLLLDTLIDYHRIMISIL